MEARPGPALIDRLVGRADRAARFAPLAQARPQELAARETLGITRCRQRPNIPGPKESDRILSRHLQRFVEGAAITWRRDTNVPGAQAPVYFAGRRMTRVDNRGVTDLDALLDESRRACSRSKWLQGQAGLAEVDAARPLSAEDLQLLGESAYMLGRDEEYVAALMRAHNLQLAGGDLPAAARTAFWIGHSYMHQGQMPLAGGWFGTAARLLDEHGEDCAEHGYLLIPVWLRQMGEGAWEAALANAAAAARIADRFADTDLAALARDEQAHALVHAGPRRRRTEARRRAPVDGRVRRALADRARHPVLQYDHLLPRSPPGPRRISLDRCAHCLVHRVSRDGGPQRTLPGAQGGNPSAGGAWDEAASEAAEAATRFRDGVLNRFAIGHAHYRQGEVHRVRGDWVWRPRRASARPPRWASTHSRA